MKRIIRHDRWDLFQECKVGKTYKNQSLYYSIIIKKPTRSSQQTQKSIGQTLTSFHDKNTPQTQSSGASLKPTTLSGERPKASPGADTTCMLSSLPGSGVRQEKEKLPDWKRSSKTICLQITSPDA